jgi:hypothetical protein
VQCSGLLLRRSRTVGGYQRGRLTARRVRLALWLAALLGLSLVLPTLAGQGYTTSVYEGQIKSIRIDSCGLQPGLCEGSIILEHSGREDSQLDIRIGTWIKRDTRFLTIEDLQVGDQVKVQAFLLPGASHPRVAILEFSRP